MKSLPTFNRPVTKTDNSQSGLVFLEYVIMAFIISTVIICTIWWLYWRLQQMILELKLQLDNIPRECPLPAPGPVQPVPTPPYAEGYKGYIIVPQPSVPHPIVPYPIVPHPIVPPHHHGGHG
ncbi:MAG: hypothetical protein AMJ43_05515 [Coxiella sp. DG_40]|nr:MAG: hypothetical protein AMJ43_05515 [Coxiella sp. DG_40]